MQNIIDQLSSATAGFDQTTWAVVGGAAFVVMLMSLVLGMVLRKPRAKKPVGADKPGVLGACGAATFACRVTPDLRVTELSADIEILTGYTAETLTNADAFVRMLDEGDAQMFESRARNAVQEEHSLVADLRYEDADGRRRWMTVRAEPTKDNRGRVTGLHGVVREITDQKRLATDAAAAWARFHALANSTTTMLWVLNEHGDCQATNSASERFAGATEDHIRGTGWAKSFPEDEYQAVIKFVGRAFDERTNREGDQRAIVAALTREDRDRTAEAVPEHRASLRIEARGVRHLTLRHGAARAGEVMEAEAHAVALEEIEATELVAVGAGIRAVVREAHAEDGVAARGGAMAELVKEAPVLEALEPVADEEDGELVSLGREVEAQPQRKVLGALNDEVVDFTHAVEFWLWKTRSRMSWVPASSSKTRLLVPGSP